MNIISIPMARKRLTTMKSLYVTGKNLEKTRIIKLKVLKEKLFVETINGDWINVEGFSFTFF